MQLSEATLVLPRTHVKYMWTVFNKIECISLNFSKRMYWSNVYGLARSLLAVGTLLTLIFNDNLTLFGPQSNQPLQTLKYIGLTQYTLFYIFRAHIGIAKMIAVLALVLTASGWRPRFTGILHWYIAFSFNIFTIVPDGGDQLTNILSLLLIPVCLVDKRVWHWGNCYNSNNQYANLIGHSVYWIIRIQVAVVYLDAATEKFKVDEWKNGTILWYLFNDPVMGCNRFCRLIFIPILQNSIILTLLTWSVIILELILFLGLTLEKKYRHRLLIVGILFHFFIIIIYGLISFFFAMAAALILYLRPWEKPFVFKGKLLNKAFFLTESQEIK